MTLRESLHKRIDKLNDVVLLELDQHLNTLEKKGSLKSSKKDKVKTVMELWEALAEPIYNKEAQAELNNAIQRRPLFGGHIGHLHI